jgi:Rrf2 family protein
MPINKHNHQAHGRENPMLVSKKARYAAQAVLGLCRRGSAQPVAVEQIAAAERIPTGLLAEIFRDLSAAGIVEPTDEQGAAYLLAKAPAEISLGELIRSVQGPGYSHACLDPDQKVECAYRASCMLRPIWQSEYAAIRHRYDSTNFQDLARRGLATSGSRRGHLV